jgi:hypothetical protein
VPPSVVNARITEAFCTRNQKTACGKLRDRCFWKMLHKNHASCAGLRDRAGFLAPDRVSRKSANLRLAAQPGVGHIRADGAVAEWLKAAVC